MYIDVYCNTVYNGTELYSTQRSLHSVGTAIVGQYAAKGKWCLLYDVYFNLKKIKSETEKKTEQTYSDFQDTLLGEQSKMQKNAKYVKEREREVYILDHLSAK